MPIDTPLSKIMNLSYTTNKHTISDWQCGCTVHAECLLPKSSSSGLCFSNTDNDWDCTSVSNVIFSSIFFVSTLSDIKCFLNCVLINNHHHWSVMFIDIVSAIPGLPNMWLRGAHQVGSNMCVILIKFIFPYPIPFFKCFNNNCAMHIYIFLLKIIHFPKVPIIIFRLTKVKLIYITLNIGSSYYLYKSLTEIVTQCLSGSPNGKTKPIGTHDTSY